jgi:enediyne biosynthesis protein E4
MHGRRRDDLTDQLEQRLVPHPGDGMAAEVLPTALADHVPRLVRRAARQRRGDERARDDGGRSSAVESEPPAALVSFTLPQDRAAYISRVPLWFNRVVRTRPFSRRVIGAVVVAAAAIAGLAVVVGAGGGGGTSTGGTAAGDAPAVSHFVDATATAGIEHRYDGDFHFFEGGGVAAFDCDDDGRPELYLAGGSEPAALYHNASELGGALHFERVTSPTTDLTDVTGAYPLDVDSDGHVDLAVLRVGEDVVLRGRGGCRFERANETLGIDGSDSWTVAFSATWEGSSALPTLAFGDYLEADRETCADSRLLRPARGDGAYAAAVALSPGYCTLSILFSDWQRTGRRDLRMSNDRNYYRDGMEQLWRMEQGAAPVPYTEAEGWRRLQIWGMGIASHDLSGDGVPEIFLTSQGDNKLQTLADGATGPTYEDIALRRGVTVHRPFAGGDVLPSTAWHAEFQDVNNDGFVDLFVSKGNVEAQPGYAVRDPSNLLLGRADGTFVESAEAAGILRYDRARGAALVDLDLDGLLDLVVVNRSENVTVWRNVGRGDDDAPAAMGHWVAVRLRQPAPNVDAVGAWLEARIGDRTVVREVTVGGGHAGGQLGWIHLGLGEADTADVRVRWPDGETGPWMTLPADGFATIERGAEQATPWHPEEDQ